MGERADVAAVPIRHAIDVARAMGSRLMEVRAVASLARLLPDDPDVKTELGATLAGLDEGMETPDLHAAAALLDVV
jgi:hypothetical protein